MASKVLNRPKTAGAQTATGSVGNGTADGQMSVTEESIRLLAYLKWEAAGKPDGDGLCFWIEAERELRPA